MIEPTRIPNNPQAQLNHAEAKKEPVFKEVHAEHGITAEDVYKSESYEFRTPGLLFGLFSKELNGAEALDRLGKGKKVKVREEVELRGTYDGLDNVSERAIEHQQKDTTLKSTEELESFARIESGAQPMSDEEEVAQMLERFELKDAEGKKDGTFYEVLNKKGKPISSYNAVKSLKDGKVVMLREKAIRGEAIREFTPAKTSYGQWLVNPDNLGKNQKLVKRRGVYGGTYLSVQSDYKRLGAEQSSDGIAFNSVNQLKDFLTTDKSNS